MNAPSPLQHTHRSDGLAVTNPATGQRCATVALSSVAEVMQVLEPDIKRFRQENQHSP